jgi:hypothetical protein
MNYLAAQMGRQGILKGDWFGIGCMTTDNDLFLFSNPNQSNRRSMVQ